MRIGFVATRLAGVDGVSLEVAKMRQALEAMGHEVFYCAGQLDADAPPGRLVPAMHFKDPVARELHDEAFSTINPSPALFRRIYEQADFIRGELEAFVETHGIDLIIPENACTIPMNLSLGIAIADLVKRTRIKTLCHHHDFYWERARFIANGIQDILDEAFPPRLEPIRHLVINTPMQRRLHSWRGISSLYLPNVFDFENPPPPPDDYALTFRSELGLSQDDLIVLQPTRLIRRKMIEKAVELMRKLNDPRLVLLITGYEGDEPGYYGSWLAEESARAGIRHRFIGDYVDSLRGERNGHKVYTLWDIYPQAHFITYPSDYEGFGNALVETIYFRKPFIVHTYPVYLADIKPLGIQAVEYHYDLTDDVLAATRRLIDDAALRERMVEQNYAIAACHFSYDVLNRTLTQALESFDDHRFCF
ncbi:MAG: glycosyltransferase family 4 protein [Chloroflexota bacterium]|nr:MAG: glycosyl transferase family 1 [Chloroflexota bacterium]